MRSSLAPFLGTAALACIAAWAQPEPDADERAGTVPVVGPDTTGSGLSSHPSPVNASGSTGNSGTSAALSAGSAPPVIGGSLGPLSTGNGVAARPQPAASVGDAKR